MKLPSGDRATKLMLKATSLREMWQKAQLIGISAAHFVGMYVYSYEIPKGADGKKKDQIYSLAVKMERTAYEWLSDDDIQREQKLQVQIDELALQKTHLLRCAWSFLRIHLKELKKEKGVCCFEDLVIPFCIFRTVSNGHFHQDRQLLMWHDVSIKQEALL